MSSEPCATVLHVALDDQVRDALEAHCSAGEHDDEALLGAHAQRGVA